MGRCRLVEAECIRLPLSDGDFLDVKRELNAGEEEALHIAAYKTPVIVGKDAEIDLHKLWLTRLLAYIVGWSLVDRDGRPLPFTPDTLRMLSGDTVREMRAAVDAHIAAQEARHTELLANPPTSSALRAIS